MSVFVLLHRLELEADANQTDEVEPYLFEDEDDAIAYAVHLMTETTGSWGWSREDQRNEVDRLTSSLGSPKRGSRPADLHTDHLVQLTRSDNEVFELYRRGIAAKGHMFPTVC